MKSTDSLLEAAKEAACSAGEKVMELYEGDYWIDKKGDDSPVTKADHLSEETIIKRLPKEEIGVVAEESGVHSIESDFCWVIDPLDGTKDFLQHTDEFAVMIGLLKEGSPYLGVVYSPAMGELTYAIKGEGAYSKRDGKESSISVSDVSDLRDYRMVISRNHFRDSDKKIAQYLGISDFKPLGSVGVKYSALAKGVADISIYTTSYLGPWDCCAPHIILEEAGGDVMNSRGEVPSYHLESGEMEGGFIGTNGKNKKKITDALKLHTE